MACREISFTPVEKTNPLGLPDDRGVSVGKNEEEDFRLKHPPIFTVAYNQNAGSTEGGFNSRTDNNLA